MEIVDLLIFGRFSSRDDPDIIFAFRICHDDDLAFHDAYTNKTTLAVVETLIGDDDNFAVEYLWHIDEIDAVLPDIHLTFAFIPFVTHISIVTTNCSYVNMVPLRTWRGISVKISGSINPRL